MDALRRDAIRRTSFVLVTERGEPFWKLFIERGDKSSYAFVPRWGGKENCFPIGFGSDETFIFVQESNNGPPRSVLYNALLATH